MVRAWGYGDATRRMRMDPRQRHGLTGGIGLAFAHLLALRITELVLFPQIGRWKVPKFLPSALCYIGVTGSDGGRR